MSEVTQRPERRKLHDNVSFFDVNAQLNGIVYAFRVGVARDDTLERILSSNLLVQLDPT